MLAYMRSRVGPHSHRRPCICQSTSRYTHQSGVRVFGFTNVNGRPQSRFWFCVLLCCQQVLLLCATAASVQRLLHSVVRICIRGLIIAGTIITDLNVHAERRFLVNVSGKGF